MDVSIEDRLAAIAASLRDGEASPEPTVREFLWWIYAERRGIWIVEHLRRALGEAGIVTEPDFESSYLDAPIRFCLVPDEAEEDEEAEEAEEAPRGVDVGEAAQPEPFADPTYRLSKLQAANNVPVSIRPDEPLKSAITLMLVNDFSQLPVMTSERDVKGMLTWCSIGARLALGREPGAVRDFMDAHAEVNRDSSLFNAMGQIVQHDYVLVRASDKRITGIVTASDLSLQFRLLTEPFLLLSEIENQIRRIINSRYDLDDLRAAVDPDAPGRQIEGVADLTFGEYIRLLQNPDQWSKLNLELDRAVFVERLDKVRQIRNDVMHFDPDGIPDDDLEVLRDFARLLQTVEAMGVI